MAEKIEAHVAAVVVTYNRKSLLEVCLDSLLKQSFPLSALFIIDNASTDGTDSLLIEKGYIDFALSPSGEPQEAQKEIPLSLFPGKKVRAHYVRMPENTGGAGGFHEGVKRAHRQGFDWIWLMDDDVRPEESCLENLWKKTKLIAGQTGQEPAALACARFNMENKFVIEDCKKVNLGNPFTSLQRKRVQESDLEKDFLRIEGMTFEGMFVGRKYVSQAGFPDKRFFIYADDYDYCLRLMKFGSIFYIPSARLIRLMRPKPAVNSYVWRSYYVIRNLIYLDLKYGRLQTKVIRTFIRVWRLIVGRVYHRRLMNLPTIFKSYSDAVKMVRQDYDYFD